MQSLIFANDHSRFYKDLRKLANEICIEILCSFYVQQGDRIEHHFIIRPDEDYNVMYKFSGPNMWMDEEELKTLQNDEVLFKIQADDPE